MSVLEQLWQLEQGRTVYRLQSVCLTLVLDLQKVFCGEVFIRCVAPQVLAHHLVQLLGKGFSQAVSQGLHHDVVVVITLKTERKETSTRLGVMGASVAKEYSAREYSHHPGDHPTQGLTVCFVLKQKPQGSKHSCRTKFRGDLMRHSNVGSVP